MNDAIKVDQVFEPYLGEQANLSDVKSAYRDASKDLHPDTGGNDTAFKRLNSAKDRLEELMNEGEVYSIEAYRPPTDTSASGSQDNHDFSNDRADYAAAEDGFIREVNEMLDQMGEVIDEQIRRYDKALDQMAPDEEMELMDQIAQGENPEFDF